MSTGPARVVINPDLPGRRSAGRQVREHAARILTAPTRQSHNTPDDPGTVRPRPHEGVTPNPRGLLVDLPAHSYVTVSLTLGE